MSASRLSGTPVLMLGVMMLAGASLLAGHTTRFDAEGWLRWGREIGLGDESFDTSGYPSWKPLPLVLAVPLAPTGSAAPLLWLFALRATGLWALWTVGRLTARRAGTLGGLVAAGLLALTPAWWTTLLGGGIEPAVVALGCAAVAAHQRQRPGWALALLAAMALGREEALILVLAYGVIMRPGGRWWIATTTITTAAVAAAWLLGDWIGSGDPLHGGDLARGAVPETPLSHFTPPEVAVALILAPPVLTLMLFGVTSAARARDRLTLAIAAAATVWIATDVALGAAGYPLPARFLIPAAAGWAAVAGVGASSVRSALADAMRARASPDAPVRSSA